MINAFTVDVEDYFQVAALSETISPDDWETWPCFVERNTGRILDLLAEKHIQGTFFILGWIAERYPALVRRIQREGHEIASHGYSHQLIYTQSPDVFRDETRRSKQLLEDITGEPVRGYRAASYSITRQSLWALDILAELGFEWDSSVFPVVHDRYGIPGTPRFPYRIRTQYGELTEFPISTCRIGRYQLPIAGGGYFRIFPYWLTRWGLGRVNREGQPFVFYLHPWEVDPDQPRVKVSARSRFRHYTNLSKTHHRLDRLLSQFRFAPVGTVLGHEAGSQETEVVELETLRKAA
ncbi:MAG: DUF3473 domain-containing protein [Gammaproteobacteria bacterium]|nr:MAG: DUF3473 domain-containing protein [Gammaproteobacteria bacterium]